MRQFISKTLPKLNLRIFKTIKLIFVFSILFYFILKQTNAEKPFIREISDFTTMFSEIYFEYVALQHFRQEREKEK